MSRGARLGALIVIDLVAWVVFTVGLMAPLTPEDGPPRFAALAVFSGLPTLLLLGATRGVKSYLGRILLVAQGLAIPALTAWLVY